MSPAFSPPLARHPPDDRDELLDVTRVHSVAGLAAVESNSGRPFAPPFLDELTLCRRDALETLRAPPRGGGRALCNASSAQSASSWRSLRRRSSGSGEGTTPRGRCRGDKASHGRVSEHVEAYPERSLGGRGRASKRGCCASTTSSSSASPWAESGSTTARQIKR